MPDSSPPTKVGILAPMKSELGPLVKAAGLHRSEDGPPVHRGTVAGIEVSAMPTGMGLANATRVARQLIEVSGCHHVLVVGIAGGLDRGRPIGAVVVPESVLDLDSGRSYPATPLGTGSLEGRLVSSDGLIDDADALDRLRQDGYAAIDMETSAIAAVCHDQGLPWTAFRGISDHTTDSGVDQDVFALSKPDGSPDLAAVAKLVARHPGRVPDLVRLGRWMQTAVDAAVARSLADLRSTPTVQA